ncbi:CHAP domain-containing protein [Pseudooceanicola sediminis]|uniref:CHAP domain-containing protein n=1 Tax=Pseudooceanicola sediminis TaxID=2211117 RepID=A0A399J377_9RHOB|nr:CHAP domain-containing protein [Pseudooceanicola sediminis]KAA2314266.1 CHAP domain-containing protein [Puniceibacterium sp. HSS470]RII39878.1 CHAP domain-containing protein [Pseudooceanicola sediminis]|tara:strand:+ start:12817 stop:13365 length:549 start_codon:yes stop_codon:yes gene_type:complete
MSVTNARAPWLKLPMLCALLLTAAACSQTNSSQTMSGLDPDREAFAFAEVQSLKAAGRRVWCVPFARNVSGIDIYGDARTWWSQARGTFVQAQTPKVGAVMAFKATGSMPLGHVAVVSGIKSSREILVDHANWERNEISVAMDVIDVSEKNDWTKVRLESNPNQFGSVYPTHGFILPAKITE